MGLIKQLILSRTTPRHLTPKDGIHYWHERVLLTLLLATTLLGVLAWIPSVYLSIKENLWVVAIADTLVLGIVLFIFFKPDLPYRVRATTICAISYLLGLILIFTLGPFGAGPLWLFFFPILTGVLMGRKASVRALILNALTVIAIGYLIQANKTQLLAGFGFKAWHIAQENPEMKWVVICANFMLLNILSTMLVTIILNGLHTSMQELSISEKKYRQIFENILDVYFESTLDGTILEVSPSIEKISALSHEELKGVPISRFYQMPEGNHPIADTLLKEDQVNGFEMELKDKTGHVLTCSINARLVRDDKGQPEKIIGIFRDITEQKAITRRKKELEERLNRSQKMEALGLLAGGVAHDLNNVLSGIVTYPDLLLMDLPEDSPMAKGLNIIQSSGQRATKIVQDLLTLSRRGVITREPVDLNEIIREFLRTPECEKIFSFHPNVILETDIGATSPQLKGSAIHLQKTVMNLVSNAAEAQLTGGVIRISTHNRHLTRPVKGYDHVHAGDYLVLSVKDRGEGIASEDLKRIFEPFFTKKVMGRSGTGLGMAVVWGTVQDHDGYIDVTSVPGEGTRFDLYFPVTMESIEMDNGKTKIENIMGKGERILVVDDVGHQRHIATTALKRLRYEPVAVASGEEAVDYIKSENVNLVLLDMIMDPGIDGLETFRRIKEINPDQKAIIASGFSQTQKVHDAIEMGVGQYIKKPYTLEKLSLALKKELSRP